MLARYARIRQRVGSHGGPARNNIRLAHEIPAARSDAKFVLTARQLLLRAAEAAATVVLNRAVRLADECSRAAVGQFNVLVIDQERDGQICPRHVSDDDPVVAGIRSSDRGYRIGGDWRSGRR